MRSRIVNRNGQFEMEIGGRRIPLYGYMTYLPQRGRYADFARA